jgi:hypothetical protein
MLSTELLQRIYEYSTIHDALHLAQTSKRNHRAFIGRKMPILYQAMHNTYGPLPELIKLVISSEQDKSRRLMGTELRRNIVLSRILETSDTPKLSIELMKKMLEYGQIAEKWAEVYPRLRWRFGSSNRRFLRSHERQRLRQAIYIHWTYSNLFHDRTYTQFAPDPPVLASQEDPRLRFLRAYPGASLAQLSEFHFHIMQVIEHDLYPSNQVVLDHYSHSLPWRSLEKLAWGERGNDYWRLVRGIMKFNPEDLLHLVEHTTTKTERADFLHAQGPHFPDTPETLNEALRVVSVERSQEAKATSNPLLCVPYCHSFAMVFDPREEDIEYWGGHDTGIVDVSPTEVQEAVARRALHSKSGTKDHGLGSRGLGFLFSNAGIYVGED